jgi:GDP-4-dehydro-6-deoxy-D-mannose reductase
VRILVTGSKGFVGKWLLAELEAAGHEIASDLSPSRTDVTDAEATAKWVALSQPDAIVHLAAEANPRAVDDDVSEALRVAVLGTLNVVTALATHHRRSGARPVLLVASSSEVYGVPAPDDLPLTEATPVRPRTLYGQTKVAQEGIALDYGVRSGLRVVVARSFNQIGPGQSPHYAVPSFASRIIAARDKRQSEVLVGNLDVRRDLTDVRDAVIAYRRLIEVAAATEAGTDGLVVNLGSGRSVTMREVFRQLAEAAEARVEPRVDPALVRAGEPQEIRADIRFLEKLTGWRPRIALETTLADVVAALPSATAHTS